MYFYNPFVSCNKLILIVLRSALERWHIICLLKVQNEKKFCSSVVRFKVIEKGGGNVNSTLYFEKMYGSLFRTRCNLFFTNFSLCHHRTLLGENYAVIQHGILFSIQRFPAR